MENVKYKYFVFICRCISLLLSHAHPLNFYMQKELDKKEIEGGAEFIVNHD
jgi:hypothetical protein